MAAVTAGMIGAAAISAGASAYGAKQSSKAANKAADQNARNVADTNALNLAMFNRSRGAVNPDTGYASAILPEYFGGLESSLGTNTAGLVNQLMGQNTTAMGRVSAYQDALRPASETVMQALQNRFNGQDLAQRLALAQPVYDARTGLAQTMGQGYQNVAAAQTSGINTGLLDTMRQLNAQRAAQGYLGTSSFDRNRLAQATIGARQQAGLANANANAEAARLLSESNLANLSETRGLQIADLDTRNNFGLLTDAINGLGSFEQAGITNAAQGYQAALSPLDYFRIAPQAYQQQYAPQVEPRTNNGQIWAGAIGQLANTAGQYAMMQGMQQGGYGYGYPQAAASGFNSPAGYYNSGLAASYGYTPNLGASSNFQNFNAGMPAASSFANYFNQGLLPTG